MRAHELATDLGCSVNDLKDACASYGIQLGTASSKVMPDAEFELRQHFRRIGLASGELDRALVFPTLGDVNDDFAAEFHEIYGQRLSVYEEARRRLERNLNSLLAKLLQPSDLLRCRVERGRVKSANRLLDKARRPKYLDRIKRPADVFTAIDDIVATRITCNNLSDTNMVLSAIESYCGRGVKDAPMEMSPDSRRNFVSSPKASGYRALHVNVRIPTPDGPSNLYVDCEIQIRTLLQHAWGELTHEDTYKPEVELSPLAAALAKRLATALAVMDEIAEDLRYELDRAPERKSGGISPENDLKVTDTAKGASASTPSWVPAENRELFESYYVVGRELTGTVVHVRDDYALVEDDLATTCILHASSFPAWHEGRVVDVTEYVRIGETVRTRIIEARWGIRPRVALELIT